MERKNASFVVNTVLPHVAMSKANRISTEKCDASEPGSGRHGGTLYITPLSTSVGDEQNHPSVPQHSKFSDDNTSLDLVESTNVTHGSDDRSLPGSNTEENEEDELSDMENAMDRFSNAGRQESMNSSTNTNTQADSRVKYYTRAITVLKYLICVTHISSLVVSLSAALASNSATIVHASFITLLSCTSVVLFLARERRIDNRRYLTLETAAKSNAIVESLFPAVVRDRLFSRKKRNKQMSIGSIQLSSHRIFPMTPKRRLEKYISSTTLTDQSGAATYADEPIAEMFHDTTIMFADIVGFTAWSSEREPAQVFMLLETLYQAFDGVAKKLKVFKVETIGGCYVAVVGLPEPRSDHAIIMAIFAWECRKLMRNLTERLETSLGPGTSALALRIGLHSGSVMAGVMRGEKSRFQLFGDTMNTASRLESTSNSGMIQVSQSTADLISSGSKSHWLTARTDPVFAKGKGMMKTWWVQPQKSKSLTFNNNQLFPGTSSAPDSIPISSHWGTLSFSNTNTLAGVVLTARENRLVDWCTDILSHSLAEVVSARNAIDPQPYSDSLIHRMLHAVPAQAPSMSDTKLNSITNRSIYPEVSEAMELPEFNPKKMASIDNDPSVLSAGVRDQLRDFVGNIATRYHDHDFHNFEHASHVLLSASKLIKRIITPDSIHTFDQEEDVHNSSFGISSDPLTQFTIMLSALVHDVDHTGVPNTVLVAECDDLAVKCANKSFAEHNSVDISLSLLSSPRFQELRAAIHSTTTERDLFHQLLVNTVLATHIVDGNLKNRRHEQEDVVFSTSKSNHRRVIEVIAHIIQASDVAHTMQHWHVFRQWNEKLFLENYQSSKSIRCKGFSSTDWYRQEISFFDDYIIPLAHNLKESGLFGVSSDEYLNYALANRDEWISKGKDIAQQLVAKADAKFAAPDAINETNNIDAVFLCSVGRAA